MLAEKCDQSYGSTLNWLCCRISFCLLRFAIQCIQGVRSSTGNPMKELQPVDLVISERKHSTVLFSCSYEAHSTCGRCSQLSSRAAAEITSLVPLDPSIFPSFAMCILPARESWVGAWEQDHSFCTQCESESCLPIVTAKK